MLRHVDRAKSFVRLRRDLEATETQEGLRFTLPGDVLFDEGRSVLRPGGRSVVDRLALFLVDHEARRVSVEGHTDDGGDRASNLVLSRRWADAVRVALVEAGVAPARLEAHGMGARSPVASSDTPGGRDRNRRVEVLLLAERSTEVSFLGR